MFSGAANMVQGVDTAFAVVLGISFVLLFLVTFLMIFFVIKFHKSKHPESKQVEDNTVLEITWTVIPLILVMVMFYYGWAGYKTIFTIPEDAFTIDVIGRMWEWQYEYPGGLKTKDLYVPVDRPVKLHITSTDVLHSFYIPAFRVKQDAVPGMTTRLWFEPHKIGRYEVFCTEYCGLKHADMISDVIVMESGKFDTWYDHETDKLNTETSPEPATDQNTTETEPV